MRPFGARQSAVPDRAHCAKRRNDLRNALQNVIHIFVRRLLIDREPERAVRNFVRQADRHQDVGWVERTGRAKIKSTTYFPYETLCRRHTENVSLPSWKLANDLLMKNMKILNLYNMLLDFVFHSERDWKKWICIYFFN